MSTPDIRVFYAKLDNQGRIVIPQIIREQLGLKEDDNLSLTVTKLEAKKP